MNESNFKRILALEPRAYWDELGVRQELEENYAVDYGVIFPKSLERDFRRRKYSAVITCLYHSPASQYFCNLARFYNVPNCYFIDGIGDIHNFLNNQYASVDGLQQLSPPYHDAIFCVDQPLVNICRSLGCNSYGYRCARVYGGRDMLGSNASIDFLITTANDPFTEPAERERFLELTNLVVKNIEDLGYSYAFRIFDDSLLSDILANDKVNLITGTFQDVISRVRGVITTPSSLVVTAAENDIPVATLEYRNTPLLVRGGWSLHLSVDVKETLQSMTSIPDSRIIFQRSLLVPELKLSDLVTQLIRDQADHNVEARERAFYESYFTVSLEYSFRVIMKRLKSNPLFSSILKKLKRRGVG